jgi:hypothetical protein
MHQMPKNIINKIMFFTTHPVAEIMKEASIFKVLAHTNDENCSESFDEGARASYNQENYDPRRWENKTDIELYTLGYQHHYMTHNYEAFESDCAFHCRYHIQARDWYGQD